MQLIHLTISKIVGLANSPSKPSIITTKDNTHTIISKIFIDDDRGTCYIIIELGRWGCPHLLSLFRDLDFLDFFLAVVTIRQIELTIARKASERSFIISLICSSIFTPPSLHHYYNIVGILCQWKHIKRCRFLIEFASFFLIKYRILIYPIALRYKGR